MTFDDADDLFQFASVTCSQVRNICESIETLLTPGASNDEITIALTQIIRSCDVLDRRSDTIKKLADREYRAACRRSYKRLGES